MDTELPTLAAPAPESLARLTRLLLAHAPSDGSFATGIQGVHAIRASKPSQELVHGLHRPALCITAQGAKTVMLGSESYDYDPARMLIFSCDLPIAAMIRNASMEKPYLSFRLDFDLNRLSALIDRVYPAGVPEQRDKRAVYVAQASEAVIDAVARLLALASDAEDAALLAPLVTDEILIRLLRGPFGGRLAQLGRFDSRRVGKAVAWLRSHFSQSISVQELAEIAHMSASTLHEQFKSMTSMSPLQFQKTLRLQEARRLMLASGINASVACQQVGYVSASQFTREYTRHFGHTPTADLARLRGTGLAEAVSFTQ